MLIVGVSCTNENNNLQDGTAKIQFRLTDAPSLIYDGVYLDLRGIKVGVADEFHYDENKDPYYVEDDKTIDVEWVTLNFSNPGLYNLLDYRNGKTVLLAGGEIPAGNISQVRLLLGTDSYVLVDGVKHPLKTPSAQTSGLKFNLHETLLSDLAYSFTIDFDAARSVVKTGNDKYILKPVIRTYADAFGGSIRGSVQPAEANAYVQIVKGTDTLISLPELDGKFLFPGLAPGLWNLTVVADSTTNYTNAAMANLAVAEGAINDVGTITLTRP